MEDILKELQADLDLIIECRTSKDYDMEKEYREIFANDLRFATAITHKHMGACKGKVVILD